LCSLRKGILKRKNHYTIHRWLGLITGVQLLFWSAGGVIFSTHDIEWVRGNEGRSTPEIPGIAFESVEISPAQAAAAAGLGVVKTLRLHTVLDRQVYAVRADAQTHLVDAKSGAVISPISEAMAKAIAQADRTTEPTIIEVSLVTENPEIEYRNKPLPAWRMVLDDEDNTHIYVDANTAQIIARRNDAWRRFDFFWMLHTMDYSGRDDFNTPWLVGFAALGLFSVLSGWMLWFLRFRSRRRAARKSPQPG
jgi:uncharacterized membrane protein YkoI